MKLDIQTIGLTMREQLSEFIEKKAERLPKFHDKIIDTKIVLKVENNANKENKVTEVKVYVPGDEFVVKKTEESFEKGVDGCIDAVIRFLKKNKDRN